jgi:hypothetical protein
MSATIFDVPVRFKKSIPDIFQNYEEYQTLEKQWIEDLEDWVRGQFGVGKYIGRTLRFPVADGEAIYMVMRLSPRVELIHLPLMDAYEFGYAHLMTASEVKKQIDAKDKWDAYMETICNVGEVRAFLAEYADEVYDMPDHALELLMDDHICVKWENKEYFVPENNSCFTEQDDKVWNYLNNQFHV